ncbi:MAG TPA: PorV/PorQ family protein [Candidatus Acidoferrales bacterium]|nr:PorV/PorQ family protein [Candidatus Acidoferrales bacterium]
MKIVKTVELLMVILISSTAFCQSDFISNVSKRGTTAASFLEIGQGARAASMGGAFVAVDNDLSAFYWNPAGLAKMDGIDVIFDHTNWLASVAYNYLAASYNLGGMGTAGFSFIASDYGDMKVTTVDNPNGTGQLFTATDIAFSLGYAINLTDNFAIGFNPKIIYQSIWEASATGFAMDLGILYKTPFDGIVLGMSISNFGTKMQMQGQSLLVTYDPDVNTTGNNGKIPAYLGTDAWSLPLNFRVGLAYSPISTDMHQLTLDVDAIHPNDNYESVNVGAEYVFDNLIAIRGGYKSLFLRDSEESFTLGFGLKHALMGNVAFSFDYAYQDFGRLTYVQQFSLGISF